MITLTLTNRHLLIRGASRPLYRELDRITSYKVAGHMFSPAYRAKPRRWDGKEHLLHYSARDGYYVPIGLAIDIAKALKSAGEPYVVVNKRRPIHDYIDLPWNESIVMRPYQETAVGAIFSGALPGIGTLRMPIRSGKTKTAARIIHKVGRPTVFAVPSQMLLEQTINAFHEALPGVDVGQIGDSVYREGFVTVATLQSLLYLRGKRADPGKDNGRPADPRYKRLIRHVDLFIQDEAHHCRGEGEWYKIPYDFGAVFKVALSATAYPDDETEQERGIMWLRGVFGPIKHDVSISDLVAAGYLMKQNVKMYRITEPDMEDRRWSAGLRGKCITYNPHRNNIIAKVVDKVSRTMGMKVLVVATLIEHVDAISRALSSNGVAHNILIGPQSPTSKRAVRDQFATGEIPVLISTVMGEGIDIPDVECVVNAAGGKSAIATIQRQRNLTVAEGKRVALLVDFFDDMNPYFREHSEARLATYRSEAAFDVEVID